MRVSHRGELCALANRNVVTDTDTCTQNHVVPDRRAASDAALRDYHAVATYAHIVAYLNKVVDLRTLADNGVSDSPAINRCASSYFDIVLNDNAADLRDFNVSTWSHHETESVLADLAARMNDYSIAYQGIVRGRASADRTVASYVHTRADHCVCSDHAAGSDFDAWSDYSTRLNGNTIFNSRAGIDMSI